MNHWVLKVAVFLILTVAGVSVVVADEISLTEEEKARATRHFEKGRKVFEKGEWVLAVEHFKVAYEISLSSDILFNIAICYENSGEDELAIQYYQLYLDKNPNAKDRADIEGRMRWIQGDDGQARPTATDDAALKSDIDDPDDIDEADEANAEAIYWGAKVEEKKLKAFVFGFDFGPSFSILGPAADGNRLSRRHRFGSDFYFDFYLKRWFAIAAAFYFGSYFEKESEAPGQLYPEKLVGAGVGVLVRKPTEKRIAPYARLMFLPTAITRATETKKAAWMNGRVAGGFLIQLPQKWMVPIEAQIDMGPGYVVNPSSREWEPGILLSAGATVGVAYQF